MVFERAEFKDQLEIHGIFTENQECMYIAGIVNSGEIVKNTIY
jgi:hypothetical protein